MAARANVLADTIVPRGTIEASVTDVEENLRSI